MKFVLPLLPFGINKMYFTDKRGIRRKDSRITDWKIECLEIIKYQYKYKSTMQVLEVDIWFYFSNYRKRDIDGGLKAVLDMLGEARIYTDDSVLADLHLHKRVDGANPRLEIGLM